MTSVPLGSRQECVVFCVREEPVLFLRAGEDFVPYTPRDKQSLHENLQGLAPGAQVEGLELAIRKEVRATGVGGPLPGRPWAAELRPQPAAQLCSPWLLLTHLPALPGPVAGPEGSSRQPEEGLPLPSCLPRPLPPAFPLHTQHPYSEVGGCKEH